MKKTIKLLLCILSSGCAILSAFTVSAQSEYYTINGKNKIATPETYTYSGSIERIFGKIENQNNFFNQPTDIYIDKNDVLYVADTGNNRIVKFTKDGNVILSVTEAGGKKLNAPEGVFVAENGDIYIADTANSRIVMTNKNGDFIKEFLKPESTLLADVSVYKPTKIAVSSKNILYILMGEKIMSVNAKNEFLGYIGQTAIGYSFLDTFLRFFASEEQKKNIEKRNATEYNNITINSKDLIYSVSGDTVEGQIKVLNSVGTNIFRKISKIASERSFIDDLTSNIFSGNVIDKSFSYGEGVNGKLAKFVDVCVDSKGILTAIQTQNGKLYQYDQEGNLLSVFGGLGKCCGEFVIPSSLSIDSKGRIYVLDSSMGNVQYFEPTAFIEQVQYAVTKYYDGDYNGSLSHWQEVMKLDDNYPLCRYGLANNAKKDEDYKAAMDGYHYTNDRKEYSLAFSEYRYSIIREKFVWIFLAVVLAVTLLMAAIIFCHRKSTELLYAYELLEVKEIGIKRGLILCGGILVHPFRTLDNIRGSRYRIRPYVAFFVITLMFIVRLLFIYTVHYPMQDIELNDVNLALEFIKLIIPVLTWACATFLISSQFGGESTFKENFIAVAYSCTPYVVVNVIAILTSYFLCWNEVGWFALMVNGVVVWRFVMLFEAIRRLNDFTIGKTFFVCILSLFCMIICWFITLFGYLVVSSVIQFVYEILQEIQLIIA